MRLRLIGLTAALAGLTLSGPSFAGCEKYGCADCSCIASTKMSQDSFPETMLEVKKLLEAKGIPPESVTITIQASKKGEKMLGEVKLPDATTMGFSCFDGCICCSWTFKNPNPTK